MLTLGRCLLPDILDDLGWTQQDLANRTGLSRSQIADWCRNRYATMSLRNAIIVSRVTGRPVESLYEIILEEAGKE